MIKEVDIGGGEKDECWRRRRKERGEGKGGE